MMDAIKRELRNFKSPLYRNSIYISTSSMIGAIAGFIFWSVAARLYPSSDVGVASALVSAINLVFTISLLGMNFSLIRFYPEYKERAAGSALIITLIASFVFSIGYALIMSRFESFKGVFSIKFFLLFVFFSMIGATYNVLSTYAIARRKAEHSFAQSVLFSLRFLLLFALTSLGALGIVSAFGLGLALGVLYGLIVIDGIKLRVDLEYVKDSFKFSLGNYIASLASSAPNYLMPTLVLSMLGKEEAAYFYIAFSIGNIILLVPNAINTSFFVEGSHGLRNIKETLKRAVAYSYAYLLVALVGVWLFGGYVLRFFGEGYAGGLPLLRLMVIGGFPAVVVGFASTVLNIQKRVRVLMAVNALRASMFLGLSYLFVPRIGILGVGLGWVGSHFGALGAMGVMFRKEIQKHISRSVPGEA